MGSCGYYEKLLLFLTSLCSARTAPNNTLPFPTVPALSHPGPCPLISFPALYILLFSIMFLKATQATRTVSATTPLSFCYLTQSFASLSRPYFFKSWTPKAQTVGYTISVHLGLVLDTLKLKKVSCTKKQDHGSKLVWTGCCLIWYYRSLTIIQRESVVPSSSQGLRLFQEYIHIFPSRTTSPALHGYHFSTPTQW